MTSIAPRLDRFSHVSGDAPALPRKMSPPTAPDIGGTIRNLVRPSAHGAHILCIPWAGASIERFFGWRQHLPDGVGLSGFNCRGAARARMRRCRPTCRRCSTRSPPTT
ncbi:thioesterase II of alpha/beta hydrolase superfamily [Burkholderia ambifaria MEX-5]|uniref:Thioesterase II of alpha/beta hydrolase superfamily n=1 Tax=Burkholderia ambifaria MEX-5 TaxID=396597 RepID=B1TG33_9BURK|nr:thioesterase II of alpha/beta hydrolase superfamily [Burkholderia ambifaria MEX-5]